MGAIRQLSITLDGGIYSLRSIWNCKELEYVMEKNGEAHGNPKKT